MPRITNSRCLVPLHLHFAEVTQWLYVTATSYSTLFRSSRIRRSMPFGKAEAFSATDRWLTSSSIRCKDDVIKPLIFKAPQIMLPSLGKDYRTAAEPLKMATDDDTPRLPATVTAPASAVGRFGQDLPKLIGKVLLLAFLLHAKFNYQEAAHLHSSHLHHLAWCTNVKASYVQNVKTRASWPYGGIA